jgi:DNA repair exonuclease SbcCD ATPase subunit
MEQQFTLEEIKDTVRAARVYCPGFTQSMFESLMELERRIADSGYLTAVQGLLRLEEEKGISCVQALEACEQLTQRKSSWNSSFRALSNDEASLVAQIKKAVKESELAEKEAARARREIKQIIDTCESEKQKLETYKRKSDKEKQRIEKEVESCYEQANVNKEEVEAAGRIKADAAKQGLSLELLMNVTKELVGQGDAREQLLEAIKKHNSLTGYLRELKQWGEQQKANEMSHIANLQSQAGYVQDQVYNLEEQRRGIEQAIAGLQANAAEEEELRWFYSRYQLSASLLELLAGWERLVFLRCNNPMSVATLMFNDSMVTHFWMDKPAVCCPHCGFTALAYDERPYQALGLPIGADFKIQLG